ncbi:MAG: 50S ribosomal protein L17 [Parcubacteria group bacterium]|nr:50S ribosomal protein L17 [Parcubacteria group bacterium]
MIHGNKLRKFGRERNQRNALMRSLAVSLVLQEKITTTEPKAKSLRPVVEKLITAGKKGGVASRRLLVSKVGERASKKLIDVIGPKYKERNGGYLRITKLRNRLSDSSKMAQIEFV